MAALQQDAIPRDVTFDAERCIELAVSDKLRYFEGQTACTFAEFWEQRVASEDKSGEQGKETSKKKKNKGEEKEERGNEERGVVFKWLS